MSLQLLRCNGQAQSLVFLNPLLSFMLFRLTHSIAFCFPIVSTDWWWRKLAASIGTKVLDTRTEASG
jgi:hypothetical protein